MSELLKLSPLPPPSVPFMLPNGALNPAWYDYLRQLDTEFRRLEDRVRALEPP